MPDKKKTAPRKTRKRKSAAVKSPQADSRISKEILIDAGDLETRVAILENGELAELYVEREPRIVGNIYKGKIANVVRGMDAAFADIGTQRNAFLSFDDVILRQAEEDIGPANEVRHAGDGEMLKSGQEVLLQVVRGPMGPKGPRVSTRLAIPGRYLVLLMGNGNYVGVSRKIDKDAERQRLRQIAERIRPKDHGIIVRTEAEGKGVKVLKQDLDYLTELARRIQEKSGQVKAPALLHEDLPLISRIIRDTFNRQVKRLVVDSKQVYDDVLELVALSAPQLKQRVTLYRDKLPLFAAHGIEEEIERLLRRRVGLSTGGYISVDETEALTTIDVNSGRLTATSGLEETILRTNLIAADEVARQLRLRDLGGIIVIDFIDMDKAKHRDRVMAAFEAALRRDRAKTKTVHLSPLGLVEMTRKRTTGSLLRLLTQDCPCCGGTGRMRSALSVALGIERDLAQRAVQEERADAFIVRAHTDVAAILVGYAGERAKQTEKAIGRPVYVRTSGAASVEQMEVQATDTRQVAEQIPLLKRGDVVTARVVAQESPSDLALAEANGCLIGIEADKEIAAPEVEVRIKQVQNSFATAQLAEKPAAKRTTRRRRPRRRKKTPAKSE
ncbi:MAG: Rne/Rng family ribonuclease [Armatimonadota bacterium]|nr:MAG: Rne/Rng family ribonuclease [Armatimonadota bacterium]